MPTPLILVCLLYHIENIRYHTQVESLFFFHQCSSLMPSFLWAKRNDFKPLLASLFSTQKVGYHFHCSIFTYYYER